jgi:glucose-1-phosphate thymidylyltransferase
MSKTKGIILAGGKATRLYPVTKSVSKQLLPVYNKPMIYYPLSVLMLAGIREILIISTPESIPQFKALLDDGSKLGLSISYAEQSEPKGLADAFIVGEKFIGKDNVCLILGDNIFVGEGFVEHLKNAISQKEGATIFGFNVNDPERYGIITLDKDKKPVSIDEKPEKSASRWAVTGLYFYDNKVVEVAKSIKPSKRGELEITDVNADYLKRKKLNVVLLGRGFGWLDTGTYNSLIDASLFIKTIEERQGLLIGSIEEVAFRMGYISRDRLRNIGKDINTSYGEYLSKIADEEIV